MDAAEAQTRSYYDAFSRTYERGRRHDVPRGYHAFVDDLEVDLVARYGTRGDVLEVGCGTGLILERIAQFATRAQGIDLSPGMLDVARGRGLDVREGSATALPFEANSFDVTCSFKVLAHVPEIKQALSEMCRVTRPGGVILAEFYNPLSFRALIKILGRARKTSAKLRENDVYTRFDAPWSLGDLWPPEVRPLTARGIRIITPLASIMQWPGIGGVLRKLEVRLADSKASVFGGFYVAVAQKQVIGI